MSATATSVVTIHLAITATSANDPAPAYRPWAVFADTIPGGYVGDGIWTGGIPKAIEKRSSGSTMLASLDLAPGLHTIYFVVGSPVSYFSYSGAVEIQETSEVKDFTGVWGNSSFTIQLPVVAPASAILSAPASAMNDIAEQIATGNADLNLIASLLQANLRATSQTNALLNQILTIQTKVSTAGAVTGTTDYLTILTPGVYQRLYGNVQPQAKLILGGNLQNLSLDALYAKFTTIIGGIATGLSGQATTLNPASSTGLGGGQMPVPNVNVDELDILGATLGDAYVLTWYQ